MPKELWGRWKMYCILRSSILVRIHQPQQTSFGYMVAIRWCSSTSFASERTVTAVSFVTSTVMESILPTLSSNSLHLTIVVSYLLFSVLSTRYRRGLREISGPWLASVSGLDRAWSCATGLHMDYHLRLHEQYGPLVRIGPKHVSARPD